MKHSHEVRDPVHTFIQLDTTERQVLDSKPVQRLRHVHQLAMTHLVYPGATHKRFEHSLGVMELATRIFDVVTRPESVHEAVREIVPVGDSLRYWRRVLRMAALCHDIGHLPFSHAAEDELLPEGWDHERLTIELIRSAEMEELWRSLVPPLRAQDVVKLAVGQAKSGTKLTDWEAVLSEMIVGDAFGADRIDYLLRDSLHAGVAYGRFDHHRLIDTLRILPKEYEGSREPALGVEAGGLQSAEALLLARYFMYSQVYFHPIRRIYDGHLKDFLRAWLSEGVFPVHPEAHLSMTDHEVYASLLATARDPAHAGHEPARRIVEREHFREVYRRTGSDIKRSRRAPGLIAQALEVRFGAEAVSYDSYPGKGGAGDFPVLMPDGRITSAYGQSEVLETIPAVAVDFIFAEPGVQDDARRWIEENRDKIIPPSEEEPDGEP